MLLPYSHTWESHFYTDIQNIKYANIIDSFTQGAKVKDGPLCRYERCVLCKCDRVTFFHDVFMFIQVFGSSTTEERASDYG